MASYSWVSITALFSYLFLLMAFLVAKKTKVINSFILLLFCMVLAAGGSFFMRIRFWPSVNFWHYVSLLGILMVPAIFYRFFAAFLGAKCSRSSAFWILFYLGAYILNLFTQVFIPTPEVSVDVNGNATYIYHYSLSVTVLLAGAVCISVQCVLLFLRYCKGDRLVLHQLRPILAGLAILVLSTALSTVPFLAGIPIDIISSVLFAYLVFYALYRKRLFKLSLLAAPGNCYLVAVLISLFLFNAFYQPLCSLVGRLNLGESISVLIFSAILLALIYVLYRIMKQFLDVLFIKEEQNRTDTIQQFSQTISRTLNKDEILSGLLDVIQKIIPTDMACVFLDAKDGSYQEEQSLSPLHNDHSVLEPDHPLVRYLSKHDSPILMEDFVHTMEYRSMWEKEKRQLRDKNVACAAPLKDTDQLIGVVLLSRKRKGKPYTAEDLSMLTSLCSVCSMAVKNARQYEKAYEEARRDELTGLFNRKSFYETASRIFGDGSQQVLSLVMLNVDDFKLYNQLYGNKEGDIALQKTADIIRASSEGRGMAFRMAGKEFTLLLPGYDIYSAKLLTESIVDQVRHMNSNRELYQLKTLTMSCGICAAPYMASTLEELISNTDFAVYTAKRSGKNRVVIYSEAAVQEHQKAEHTSSYETYAATIVALTAAIDTKDHYTFSHSQNVAEYAMALARECGMSSDFVSIIREAGLLHDIGKIGISETILNKPARLTSEEYEIIKTHVENSVGIIRHLPSLDYVIPAVISHHERYDGKGYPRGIAGESIPLMGRILCVADSFDAMISRRNYKKAMPLEEALAVLERERGKQFDPRLVDVFIKMIREGKLQVKFNSAAE